MSWFTPVKPQRVYEQIVDQVLDRIQRGEFPPGSQLPAERELAQQLQVSRTSLREALTVLQMMGLIETRSGQGTFVSDGQASAFLQFESSWLYEGEESPFSMLHARKAIEPSIAALAARRRSQDDLKRLDGIQHVVDAEKLDHRIFTEGDRKFHLAIAQMTGNPVIVRMMSIIYQLMGQKLWSSLRDATLCSPERFGVYAEQHWAIYRAIEDGDSAQAYDSMMRHLESVEEFMSDSDMSLVPERDL